MKAEFSMIKCKITEDMIGKECFILPDLQSTVEADKIGYGQLIKALVKYAGNHNIRRHDLFWACAELVSENLSNVNFKTAEMVVEQCKIDVKWIKGWFYHKSKKTGNTLIQVLTKSISFFEMSHREAEDFYSRAFPQLAEYLKCSEEVMVEQAKSLMGGRRICQICGKKATQRHHKFSQTKVNRAKYGDYLDDDFNIAWLCADCHTYHAKVPASLIWSEKKFLEEKNKFYKLQGVA